MQILMLTRLGSQYSDLHDVEKSIAYNNRALSIASGYLDEYQIIDLSVKVAALYREDKE